jgi:hypothetical protein
MSEYDKLPRGMREALMYSDHNWSGEQLYRAYRKRNAKVRTTALAVAFIRDADAKKHASDTADFYFGVMPGQREVTQMSKRRVYYTLLSREPHSKRWVIEFGDYDRNVVRDERDDMKDGDYCDHAFKIITTGETQAEIDAEVARLNAC